MISILIDDQENMFMFDWRVQYLDTVNNNDTTQLCVSIATKRDKSQLRLTVNIHMYIMVINSLMTL